MIKRLYIKYILVIILIILLNISLTNSASAGRIIFDILILLILLYITIFPYDLIEENGRIGVVIEGIILLSLFLILYTKNNLLSLYITLELFNICIYIYIFKKYSIMNNINIINYYIISSISSIILLFSILNIYREVGDINIDNIYYINIEDNKTILPFFLSFIIKLGVGPFYIWKLELYNQLDILRLLFLSTVPIYLYITLITYYFTYLSFNIYIIINIYILFILFSILISSFGFLYYSKVNVLLIFSSIYNTALLLFNVVLYILNNYINYYFFFFVYVINLIGLSHFLFINKKFNNSRLRLIPLIFSFSLIGFPPLAGFFSKFYIVYSTFVSHSNILFLVLAILILVSSVMIASLYLKFVNFNFDMSSGIDHGGKYNDLPIAIISISFSFILLFLPLSPYCLF